MPPLTSESRTRILVADDERPIREILADFLVLEGYDVHTVEDGRAALVELERRSYDLVLTDLKMPHLGGLELIEAIGQKNLGALTIIMTGFGTVETAIAAMKKGASDYLLKPFKVEEVMRVIARALDQQRLQRENIELREAVTLYQISEAMAQSLDIDHILELIVKSVQQEIGADLVTLMLADPHSGHFVERVRRVSAEAQALGAGQLRLDELLSHYRGERPLLVHGPLAQRFLSYPSDEKGLQSFCSVPLRVQDRVIGMLNAYSYTSTRVFTEGQRKLLAVLASRTAVSIEHASLYADLVTRNTELAHANRSLEDNFKATLVGFAHALEEADRYTRGHSERVSFYAHLVATGLDLAEPDTARVIQAGLMHDIGKIGIKYERLNKPGKLTPEEMAMFRTHPAKGKRILETMPFMNDLVPGAWCHHEHWDGSGYPRGLMHENIPLVGRIVAIADCYDAMTSDRAYRKALPHDVVINELQRCAGSQFEAPLVDVFVRQIEAHRRAAYSAGAPPMPV